MPFISDAASAIKNRFGFQDHASNSANPPRGSPDFLKSATKESVAQMSAIRSIGEFNDEDAVGDVAVSSGQIFELREDPSFWKDHNVQVTLGCLVDLAIILILLFENNRLVYVDLIASVSCKGPL